MRPRCSTLPWRRPASLPLDQLNTLRKLGSIYQGHPDMRFIPSLEASTGSLGEGLSLALGMGLAARLDGRSVPHLRHARRWRDPGRASLGGRHGRRLPQARQRGGHRGLQRHPARWLRQGHHGESPRWPTNGAPSAGTPSRSTATNFPPSRRPSQRPRRPRASPPASWPTPSRARASPSWRTIPSSTARRPRRRSQTGPTGAPIICLPRPNSKSNWAPPPARPSGARWWNWAARTRTSWSATRTFPSPP